MKRTILLTTAVLLTLAGPAVAAAAKNAWRHSGSMHILTTPQGANLPAAASVEAFPLLVRLHKDFFDFRQAQAKGQDIRFFTPAGAPLPYQIEQWDGDQGAAAVWVRIPKITGNARQEIKLQWGNPTAACESNGKAVFDKSNGYLAVWHMNDPVTDSVGTIASKDEGTTPAPGMIAQARRFPGKKGIFCGDKITTFPTGSQPHSSEAWFRGEKQNCRILSWGKEARQGKIQMWYRSPSQISMDCYFSDANVKSTPSIPLNEWTHVIHTYTKGEARIYINGALNAVAKSKASSLNIESPARMWIGGWYNSYDFIGDIDEVRISGVTRSPEWINLQYENQKPLHTLVGPLVQPGDAMSVSPASLTVPEGKSATITANVKGAQKIYWLIKRDGKETVTAVDRSSFAFDAARINGDESLTLQLKAIYPDRVKTVDIPVKVTEAIPDPVFTLTAPPTWDGRKTIEITPKIANLDKMKTAGASELNYKWNISGLAVIKEIAPGKLTLQRAQNSGKLTVSLTVNNGGTPVSSTTAIAIKEPEKDAWIARTPGKDEKPQDNQFYARNDANVGLIHCNGTLTAPADSLLLKVYADDKLTQTLKQKPTAKNTYAFTAKLKPGLIKYRVELVSQTAGAENILHTAANIVCGDAYIIDGQSNALATDTREKSPLETNEWIRSYARPRHYKADKPDENLWCNPVWKAGREHTAELGWWGMVLAKRLLKSQKVPIFIINAAVGGSRIDQHQRSKTDPEDLQTIYGRMLWRIRQAKLTHGIRAVLWHQGENDQGAAGPDGDFGWKTYQQYFVDMSASWKTDFPNVRHYYIFQIWPNSCSMGNGNGDMLREKQRTLPDLYSNMSIMSTHGITPPGPAHFPLTGWAEFARLIQPLIERDFYNKAPTTPITPANLKQASYAGDNQTITLEFDQPVVWTDSLIDQFYLDGVKDKVASGSVSGNTVTLKLKEASKATKITYLKEMSWSQKNILIGKNGIAALTFCDVSIGTR